MTENTWCEVCQHKEEAATVEKLMEQWFKHTSTNSHQQNVIKYLQYDLGALTLEEIPQKLTEYIERDTKKS